MVTTATSHCLTSIILNVHRRPKVTLLGDIQGTMCYSAAYAGDAMNKLEHSWTNNRGFRVCGHSRRWWCHSTCNLFIKP